MNKLLITLSVFSMMALSGCSKDKDLFVPYTMNFTIESVQIVSGDVAAFCAGTGTLALRISGQEHRYTDGYQTRTVARPFATDPSISAPTDQNGLHLEPCAYFPSNFTQVDSYGQEYATNRIQMDSQCRIRLAGPEKAVHSVGSVTMSMKGEITHARMQPSYKGFKIDCP